MALRDPEPLGLSHLPASSPRSKSPLFSHLKLARGQVRTRRGLAASTWHCSRSSAPYCFHAVSHALVKLRSPCRGRGRIIGEPGDLFSCTFSLRHGFGRLSLLLHRLHLSFTGLSLWPCRALCNLGPVKLLGRLLPVTFYYMAFLLKVQIESPKLPCPAYYTLRPLKGCRNEAQTLRGHGPAPHRGEPHRRARLQPHPKGPRPLP